MAEAARIESQDAAIAGKITDADIARARSQIGVPMPARVKRHEPVPSVNGIAHFAFSYGDDNPLWHDPDYGRNTRWGTQIAPGPYVKICGVEESPPATPERKKLFAGLYRGVGEYHSGTKWEFYRPVTAGNAVFFDESVSGVDVRETSKFSGGRAVHMHYRELFVDRFGIPFGITERLMISAERGGSKKTAKHAGIDQASYTDDEIATIDSIYAAEKIRGAETRWWEDVQVGETLQPVAKGPMLVTDIIADHLGRGMGHYGHGPLRYWWKTRKRMPNFYSKNEFGIPDVVQRLHWEAEWAGRIGLPIPYDYGYMRTRWLYHVASNWMGDDAWLWKMTDQIRAFNFIGDWHLMEGKVVGKRIDGTHCVADLEMSGTNQRGTVTCRGTAVIILPSRQYGPVVLPTPPSEHLSRGATMIAEAVERRRNRH